MSSSPSAKSISLSTAQECWAEVERLLAQLKNSEPVTRDALPREWKKRSGVYVFFDGDVAIYVGRGRDLYARVKQHARLSVKDAPLAVHLAKVECGIRTSYRKGEGRASWWNRPDFVAARAKAKARIATMTIKGVVVPDDHNGWITSMLEVAAAIVTNATLNKFHTT